MPRSVRYQLEWNWLFGEYPSNPSNPSIPSIPNNLDARIVHSSIGGPCFEAVRDCDDAHGWFSKPQRRTYAAGRPKP